MSPDSGTGSLRLCFPCCMRMACVERVWCFVELASSTLSARAQRLTALYCPTHPCPVQDKRWRNRSNHPVPELQPHGLHSGKTCRRECTVPKLQPHGLHLGRTCRRDCTVPRLQPHGLHLGRASRLSCRQRCLTGLPDFWHNQRLKVPLVCSRSHTAKPIHKETLR